MDRDWSAGLYAKQFIVGPAPVNARNIEPRVVLGASTTVGSHRLLTVTSHAVGDVQVVALGHLMDPRFPERGNAEVLVQLADGLNDFGTLETRTAALGGRWVLLVQIRGDARLYLDATGTKSVFHTVTADGAVWAASQPSLLSEALGLPRDDNEWNRFHSHRCSANSWPGELTPYRNVRQLLPNHYLDLRSGQVVRHWPVEEIAHQSVEQAAHRIGELLHGIMASTVARGTTGTPLSGGYDSRTLFASAGSLRTRMQFFSIRGLHLPHHDFVLPRRLAETFGHEFRIVPAQRYPDAFWKTLQHNVAGMWSDPSDYMMYTFGAIGVDFVLHGMISEIARCFYYESGEHPQTLSASDLAKAAHYQDHPMAIESFSHWLAGVPAIRSMNILDLFYWEHRVANWASLQCTGLDMLVDPIAPYNCRELLVTALGVDIAHRKAPHELHRAICRHSEARTLEVPFNEYWLDDVEELLERLIPWRIKNAYRRARMKSAGFE